MARAHLDSRPRLVVAKDATQRAGVLLAAAMHAAIDDEGAARLAMPGGSAAAAVGVARQLLGDAWSHVLLTWVDERCVPFDDPDSNRGEAYRQGVLSVDAPAARELPLWLDGEEPIDAVDRVIGEWEEELRSGLDVVLLGVGEDGHVASLFPGRSPAEGVVDFVSDSPKPPARRITRTRVALATAGDTILLATGERKREALTRLLRGDPELPAHGLPGLVIVTDQELGDIA